MTGDIGLEVWRGGVNTWECDEMGHMNVRFYVARAMEGIVGLAGALGLEGAFKANAQATLLIKDQHIRFIREARPGAALHMTAGVIEIGENEARFLHLLIHSATGEVAASFQTVVTHATPGDERPFAWSDRTRGLAEGLMTGTPAAVAPRSLIPTAVATRASLAEADSLGLARLGAGAFGPGDCDVFGRMRPEIFIGRVADSVPRMAQIFGGATSAEAPAPPARVGGAVLEYRLLHLAWPRAGDRFELRSGLAGVDRRARRVVHWLLDPATGDAWGSAEAIAVSLDLGTRKILPLGEAEEARLREAVTPGLSL
ncbi:MAG: thioesterase family protein [Pseudomonadota bacterium]